MTEVANENTDKKEKQAKDDLAGQVRLVCILFTFNLQKKNLAQDFEDMKNARIASKQRLEQRFTNVYT